MVEYVVETMLKVENLGQLVIVGPQEIRSLAPANSIFVPCKDSMVANLKVGIEALGLAKAPYLLVATSDIPLITVAAVDDFIKQCFQYEAKVYYPLVTREANQVKYPQVERTYFTLKEGTFTGGNLMLLDPSILEQQYDLVDQLVSLRKKPAKIIKMLGFKFIYKYVKKTLSLEEIEKRAEVIIGYKGKAIVSNYPEIGIDVDKPSDLKLMEEIFSPKCLT